MLAEPTLGGGQGRWLGGHEDLRDTTTPDVLRQRVYERRLGHDHRDVRRRVGELDQTETLELTEADPDAAVVAGDHQLAVGVNAGEPPDLQLRVHELAEVWDRKPDPSLRPSAVQDQPRCGLLPCSGERSLRETHAPDDHVMGGTHESTVTGDAGHGILLWFSVKMTANYTIFSTSCQGTNDHSLLKLAKNTQIRASLYLTYIKKHVKLAKY